VQDSIRRLESAIKEVDEKRIADNSKVLAALDTIKQAIASRPPPRTTSEGDTGGSNRSKPTKPERSESGRTSNGGNSTEDGYSYAIKSGDTLSGLVSQLRSQGIKVTQKQVTEANPNVNWNRLKVGQSIFIPKPAE
jgi:Tfp pilus assembly protein FimV